MSQTRSRRKPFPVADLVIALVLVVAVVLLLGAAGGCEESRAKRELQRIEQQVDAEQDHRSELDLIHEQLAEALKRAQDAETREKIEQERKEAEAALQRSAERLAKLEKSREEQVAEVAAAKKRDDAWLGLGDVGAGALAGAIPTGGAVIAAAWGIFRRARPKWQAQGIEAGVREGAEQTIKHVRVLRQSNQRLDEAFDELPEEAKRLGKVALEVAPAVARVIEEARKR